MTNGNEILHIRVKLSEFYFNNDQSELLLKQVIAIITCFSDFSDKNLFWSC